MQNKIVVVFLIFTIKLLSVTCCCISSGYQPAGAQQWWQEFVIQIKYLRSPNIHLFILMLQWNTFITLKKIQITLVDLYTLYYKSCTFLTQWIHISGVFQFLVQNKGIYPCQYRLVKPASGHVSYRAWWERLLSLCDDWPVNSKTSDKVKEEHLTPVQVKNGEASPHAFHHLFIVCVLVCKLFLFCDSGKIIGRAKPLEFCVLMVPLAVLF